VALASAALATDASARHRAQRPFDAAPQTVVVRENVPAAGVYAVKITVTTATPRRAVVDVTVGRRVHRLRTSGRGRLAHLSLHVRVKRKRVLAIGATEGIARPRLAVSLKRLRGIAPTKRSPAPARHLAVTGTTGPTGVTGAPSEPVAAIATAPAAPTAAATTTSPPSPPPPTGVPGPPGDPSSWHTIFDDEFNGTSLDTSKWSTGWYGSGITAPVNAEELQCYDPNQVSVAGGELDLNLVAKTESCGGQTRSYASGLVSTSGKFSYTYGYLEARVWLPGGSAVTDWPAVWTDGQSWPTDGELDAVEGLGGQACWHFHDPLGAFGGCSQTTMTGGWHTFGADWEPGSVTYYYDGLAVGTVTQGITGAPMYVILDLAADNANGGALQAPATMRVDYVRIWQH